MGKSVSGADMLVRKLKQLNSRSAEKRVGAALYAAGDLLRVEAALSISEGSVSGKSHVPSKPGEPPNFDTGFLAGGIETRVVDDLEVNVVSTAPYAAIQEFGGTINHPGGQPYFIKDGQFIPVSKSSPAAGRLPKTKPHKITLPERPYMRPAAKIVQPEAVELVRRALRNEIGRK